MTNESRSCGESESELLQCGFVDHGKTRNGLQYHSRKSPRAAASTPGAQPTGIPAHISLCAMLLISLRNLEISKANVCTCARVGVGVGDSILPVSGGEGERPRSKSGGTHVDPVMWNMNRGPDREVHLLSPCRGLGLYRAQRTRSWLFRGSVFVFGQART